MSVLTVNAVEKVFHVFVTFFLVFVEVRSRRSDSNSTVCEFFMSSILNQEVKCLTWSFIRNSQVDTLSNRSSDVIKCCKCEHAVRVSNS